MTNCESGWIAEGVVREDKNKNFTSKMFQEKEI